MKVSTMWIMMMMLFQLVYILLISIYLNEIFLIQRLNLIDERVKGLCIAQTGDHIAGDDDGIEMMIAKRIGKPLLFGAEAFALEIGNVQDGISIKGFAQPCNGNADAAQMDKLIENEIDGKDGPKENKKTKGKPQVQRRLPLRVKKVMARCGGCKARCASGRKRIIAGSALGGTSVHRQASLTSRIMKVYIIIAQSKRKINEANTIYG